MANRTSIKISSVLNGKTVLLEVVVVPFGNTRTCVNSDLKVLSTLFLALHSYFPASLSDADSIISLDLVL